MKQTKTNVCMSIIAVILSIVLFTTAIVLNNTEQGTTKVVAVTRTIDLSIAPEYETYLKNFDEKTLDYDDNQVSFHGVMGYDERVLSMFDQVALAESIDTEQSNIVYDCSFDMEKMQFTFKAVLLDENDEVIEIDETVTDAFVTEMGRLDAYIELNGETYLLSDFVSTDGIDKCIAPWLIALIVVVVIVVVYVVVAESAEQIKAKKNYEANQKREAAGNGVKKGNYITKQSEKSRKDYKSGDYLFGFTTFDGVGCEVASVYNLLISLGRGEMLSQTIYNFEKWALEYSVGWGHLGSDPDTIYRYLKNYSISYTKYKSLSNFRTALAKEKNCYVIMSTWNKGAGTGLHTYYFEKLNNGKLSTYNFHYDTAPIEYNSLDIITSNTGNFICAYIIKK
ncbi:MAG: hypothetical protein NC485_14380 [Ruminococcus flavefaciens]|nr:hypothetical protein [Ruminococcus flavefaciens]